MTSSTEAGTAGSRPLRVVRESSLRERILARDEQALVELVELATPWLLGVTQGMLSDPDEAESVVMETFHIAWDRIETVEDQGLGLIPWLLRVARNRAIDRLRARKRQQAVADRADAAGELGDSAVAPIEPNEAAQPGWHVHDTVQEAVGALPSDQEAVVRLAYYQGLTQSEIADRLDIPLGTVKTRLRLAFDKLRVSLATVKDWII
jgi:RNA polymerase sigma-70 factor (ECF subfamily)